MNIIFPPVFNFSNAEPNDDDLLTELNIQIYENDICPGFPTSNMDESCIFKNCNIIFKINLFNDFIKI
jgi:hypothetical protein